VKRAWQARWWWKQLDTYVNLGTFTDLAFGSREAAERAAGKCWKEFAAAIAGGASPLIALRTLKASGLVLCKRTSGVTV
jgi:hypothetical protein